MNMIEKLEDLVGITDVVVRVSFTGNYSGVTLPMFVRKDGGDYLVFQRVKKGSDGGPVIPYKGEENSEENILKSAITAFSTETAS